MGSLCGIGGLHNCVDLDCQMIFPSLRLPNNLTGAPRGTDSEHVPRTQAPRIPAQARRARHTAVLSDRGGGAGPRFVELEPSALLNIPPSNTEGKFGMSKYNDPAHWRARAAQSRVMADRMIRPDDKERMHRIAEQYDIMADRAAERLKAVEEGRPPLVREGDDDGDSD